MKGIYWLLRESPKVCRLQAQTKQLSQDVAHCHCQPYSYLLFFSQARQWLITATRVEVSRKRKKTKTMTTTKPRSLGRWKIPSALFLPIQPSTISSHGQDLKKKKEKVRGNLGAALPHRTGEGQVSLKASGKCLAGPGGTGHSWTFRWSSPLRGGLKSSWEVARRPTQCMNPNLNKGGSGG